MRKIEIQINPYKSAGPIVFGATRPDNRSRLEERPKVPAVVDGGMPGDEYQELGLYVMYDKYNRCAGVECFRPASVFFEGKNLLRCTYRELYDYFKNLDPHVVEGAMEFTSYKYGIAVFDPDQREKPEDPCKWIAAFRENYFNRKLGVADPGLFSTFSIQPGFVEGIETENKTYMLVEEAFSDMFRRNKEYMMLLWNSFPVRFSYIHDIPFMIREWVNMLEQVSTHEKGNHFARLESDEFSATWALEWSNGRIGIESHWKKIPGGYQAVLNEQPAVSVSREEFLYEWKILLQQLVQAIDDSGCDWHVKAGSTFVQQLTRVEQAIKQQGKFYRKESLELIY